MTDGEAGAGAQAGAPECLHEPSTGEGVLDDSVIIASAADAEALQWYAEISGDVRVASSFEGVLELHNLRAIGGSLNVESALIENNTVIDWARITELRLPNLERIGGQLFIYLTKALVTTDFRSLETVGDRVYIHRNVGLRRVGFDALGEAGAFYLSDCFEISECEIDTICARPGMTCNVVGTDASRSCETVCGHVRPLGS